MRTAQAEISSSQAPLRSRMQINRENALKSTGPRTPEGKARSRTNAVRHGITAHISLAAETASVIAPQFWLLAESIRPKCVMGVNALLELSLCMWKNRRLFEDFAANHARSRLVEPIDRFCRDQRRAVKWFDRLLTEPRNAMAQLESSEHGLKLLISTLQNSIQELQANGGYWTMVQFDTVLGIAGFHKKEVWQHVVLRKYWSAMAGVFSDRNIFLDHVFPLYLGTIDTQKRLELWTHKLPSREEGRQILEKWATQLKDRLVGKLQKFQEMQSRLEELNNQAAGWPSAQNSCQHILHLRYTSQVDRKTRQILDLLNILPKAGPEEPWSLDESLLPPEWASVLLEYKSGDAPENACEGLLTEFKLLPMPVEPEPVKQPAVVDSTPIGSEMELREECPDFNQSEQEMIHEYEDHITDDSLVANSPDESPELKSTDAIRQEPKPRTAMRGEAAMHTKIWEHINLITEAQLKELCEMYEKYNALDNPITRNKGYVAIRERFKQMVAETTDATGKTDPDSKENQRSQQVQRFLRESAEIQREIDEFSARYQFNPQAGESLKRQPVAMESGDGMNFVKTIPGPMNDVETASFGMNQPGMEIEKSKRQTPETAESKSSEISSIAASANQAVSKRRQRRFRPDRASKLKPPSQRNGANAAQSKSQPH